MCDVSLWLRFSKLMRSVGLAVWNTTGFGPGRRPWSSFMASTESGKRVVSRHSTSEARRVMPSWDR